MRHGTVAAGAVLAATPQTAAHHIIAGRAELLEPDPAVAALLPQEGDGSLPEDFPARGALIEAGLGSLAAVERASDEDLLAVPTIGRGTLRRIRQY